MYFFSDSWRPCNFGLKTTELFRCFVSNFSSLLVTKIDKRVKKGVKVLFDPQSFLISPKDTSKFFWSFSAYWIKIYQVQSKNNHFYPFFFQEGLFQRVKGVLVLSTPRLSGNMTKLSQKKFLDQNWQKYQGVLGGKTRVFPPPNSIPDFKPIVLSWEATKLSATCINELKTYF